MNYKEQIEFIKSLGFIPTGFGGVWSDNKHLLTIEFIGGKIIITEIIPISNNE